jgi:signal transduction histidine kinase
LRHTKAKNAFVNILCEDSYLLLKLGNDTRHEDADVKEFAPRSISERSRLLGGDAVVERRDDGYTIVSVTIPM